MTIYFITYGNDIYKEALIRIKKEANDFNIFDIIICYKIEDLKNDTSFWNKHSSFISNNSRGNGYWIWKSYLIQKTLNIMKDEDILVYVDCGCELNNFYYYKMIEYFNMLKKNKFDILCTTTKFIEKDWNKKDLFIYLQLDNKKYTETEQLQAGIIILKKTNKIVNFINDWYYISCIYNLIDDSPSIEKNYSSFKEHRHDQSIFSLLCKKKLNFYIISSYYFSPIIVSRNKSRYKNTTPFACYYLQHIATFCFIVITTCCIFIGLRYNLTATI